MSLEEITKKIDHLVDSQGDRMEIFDIVKKAMETDADHIEVRWRLSRAHFMLSEVEPDKKKKYEHLKEGQTHAKKCIELDKDHYKKTKFFKSKWYAITTAISSDFEGTNERIKSGYIIRENLDKALSLSPKDATTCFCIAKWCFGVANLGTIQRTLAATFFEKPPSSTYDEAIDFCKKVEEILNSPENGNQYANLRIRNKTYCGDCYYAKGEYEEAKKWYALAIKEKVSSQLDKEEHEEAEKKLKQCSSSWW
eukprot:gene530-8042_t